ncbi:hypothetical protein [Pontivivens insulae]|uniref:Uncharacterized protein n=1 Tax=Pontivivens insulae TaxID=1639689 RepID=A0A2R8A9N2_9RHOB|nr:hypothetical protein [Pontivivens insulae]RED12838.1 hypothetical protein DFR53_1969 [Pontivivens insulae]SPF28929.1 hypothetical protein POI8812_01232 [Pontivivens insulae]
MSRARIVKLVLQVLACGAALMAFLAIDGLVLPFVGFFGAWIVGSGIANWAFRRLATPEDLQADLRDRADSID